jgi:hypothetical protein
LAILKSLEKKLPQMKDFKDDEEYSDYITLTVKDGGFVKNGEG